MDHFTYHDGRLQCEDVDLGELAARAGTPTFVYSRATLELHYDRIAEAFSPLNPLICYSVKSCSNINILKVLADRGAGMDVVSGGELHRTRLAGVPGSKVLYAGVGKTESEIRDALGASPPLGLSSPSTLGGRRGDHSALSTPTPPEPIGTLNIESESEFKTIAAIAKALNVTATAALRINPDVDPHTHAYTTTGTAETKFGVDLARAKDFFTRYRGHSHLKLTGIHLHLGSPINSTAPYVEAVTRALALIDDLRSRGIHIDTFDLGGGFAADYTTGNSLTASDYAAAIVPLLKDRVAAGLRIIIEPGRVISANAGVLLTRVQYVKLSGHKKFIICDAGMHTLIRPALYSAFHFIWPATVAPQHTPDKREPKPGLPGLETADVVGPICESSDFLAKDRPLPPIAKGDLLAVFAAGAYGMSMASRYNSHPFPAEVLIDGTRATIIRQRETYEDLVRDELEPRDLGV